MPKPPATPSRHRGVAMLLVIVSLVFATILTTAYLASRDNSTFIGSNITDSTVAQWASETGLEYGIVVLQTEVDWRNEHVDGKLVDDLDVNGALLDLDVFDLETDSPPTDETEYVMLISTARAGDIEQASAATAHVPRDIKTRVDVDLDEFAIYAAESLLIDNGSTVTQWSSAPLADTPQRINMGTQQTSSSSIDLSFGSDLIDATVFRAPGSSGSLVTTDGSGTWQEIDMLDTIPMPNAPTAPDSSGMTAQAALSVLTPTTLSSDNRHTQARVRDTLTLNGDITFVSDGLLFLYSTGTIVIDGNVTMIAADDLTIAGGSIELTPDSTLTLFVGDQLAMSNGAYIGEQGAASEQTSDGFAPYIDADRVRLYDMSQPGKSWNLLTGSIVKANLYAPHSHIVLQDDSALYGRSTSQSLSLQDASSLFYDPGLNKGNGFSNPDSQLYDSAGRIRPEVYDVLSLDASELDELATSLLLDVVGHGTSLLGAVLSGGGSSTGPTDRPLRIVYDIVEIGEDNEQLEHDSLTLIAADLMSENARVRKYSLSDFSGITITAQENARRQIADDLHAASKYLQAGDGANALATLDQVYGVIDDKGGASPADLMVQDSPRRERLKETVANCIKDLKRAEAESN